MIVGVREKENDGEPWKGIEELDVERFKAMAQCLAYYHTSNWKGQPMLCPTSVVGYRYEILENRTVEGR